MTDTPEKFMGIVFSNDEMLKGCEENAELKEIFIEPPHDDAKILEKLI